MKKCEKYRYYENSVQTPHEHVQIFNSMFRELRGKEATTLKEDFCGTFLISSEWVRQSSKHRAIGVDLDQEPLNYGKKHRATTLTSTEMRRIQILKQDVCHPTKNKVEIIGVGNFSFYIFKERNQLKKYFSSALRCLQKDGIFALEMAGGPGFIKTGKEQRSYTVPKLGRYTYYWHQKSFDPILNWGSYSIHFKTAKGVLHRDCFTYDWRVWTIPEVKELLLETGFKKVEVFWEGTTPEGTGSGEYLRSETGDNAYSWIAFVVGMR